MKGNGPGQKNRLAVWTVMASLLLATAVAVLGVASAQTSPGQYQAFLPIIYKQFSPGSPTATPTIGPPTPTPSPTPWPTATPIPCDVEISSYRLFEFEIHPGFYGLVAVGELNNLSTEWSHWLMVRLILFDNEGFVVLSQTADAFYPPLPGDHAPFKFNILEPPTWTSHLLMFDSCDRTSPPEYHDWTLNEVSTYVDEYNVFHVAGVVTNDDSVGAEPNVGVAFYDSTGAIWQADYTLDVPYLLPGQKARFDIAVWGPVEGYASYEVRTWGW